MSVAALPMYDLPEITSVTDAWWRGLADHLRRAGVPDVPDLLERDTDRSVVWADPNLVLAQTCGYPLTHSLAGVVRLVAVPVYGAPGCQGAMYRSLIVVNAESDATELADLRGMRAAINGTDSQSGCNALRAAFAPLAENGRFFFRIIVSGMHRASLGMVAAGEADVCTVDCVTHTLLARHAPEALNCTRVLAETASAPSLPYITAGAVSRDDLERLRQGLTAAASDPALADVRTELLLLGFEILAEDAYGVIIEMENRAEAGGGIDLI
jgi:ABC-type phosphate/phosphonate transport system substrate-binding protein